MTSRIEKVIREVSDLRDFYLKLQKAKAEYQSNLDQQKAENEEDSQSGHQSREAGNHG